MRLVVLIVAIAACSKRDPVANDLKPMNLALTPKLAAPDPAGGPPGGKTAHLAQAASAAAAVTIPPALHGRWGLSPVACTGANDKGLLIVTADGLRFYESRAVPTADVQTSRGSINGHFRFTGEGQAWDKFEALQRNGDKLTRTETNPAASYTYAKC